MKQQLEAITAKPRIGLEEPGLFYPNSAQRIDLDTVVEAFPTATAKGAVPSALIGCELGPGMVVGRVAIRRETERLLGGKDQKSRANLWLKKIPLRVWRGVVDYIPFAELEEFVLRRASKIKKDQVARAGHARRAKGR